MIKFLKNRKRLQGVVLTLVLAAVSLYMSTCETPMGMGDPIDFEPPVLKLDPDLISPKYVRLGSKLSGTVTDNIAVERVILREAGSGKELFKVTSFPNNRWEIDLDKVFDVNNNGSKIAVEIVAFDKMGNSGGDSIKAIMLIIDIRPPIIEDIEISRSSKKRTIPRTYEYFENLEKTKDTRGENSEFVDEYQNGYFHITGQASENETDIEIIALNIYDINNRIIDDSGNDVPLLTLPPLTDSSGNYSAYSPKWLVWEEGELQDVTLKNGRTYKNIKGLITAGVEAFGQSYEDDYYINGKRYYYLLEILAVDNGGNPSKDEENIIKQESGIFCLWERADEPKGIIDPGVGKVVQGGATIPIEFFDDDTLDFAYTGMFTKDQWDGVKPIAPSLYMMGKTNATPGGISDSPDDRLSWLSEWLPGDVYDWHYDIYSGTSSATEVNGKSTKITELLAGKDRSELFEYIQTGTEANDYGEFIIFTYVGDKKLDPHTGNSSKDTDKKREKLRYSDVSVIDANQPLIVFDTVDTSPGQNPPYDESKHPGYDTDPEASTGNCPEENTFPKLDEGSIIGSGGRYFEINGYTLRATKTGTGIVENYVKKFRMAWIPYGISGGADSKIGAVQEALKAVNYPASFNVNVTPALAGVQHWNFVPTNPNPGGDQPVGEPGDPSLITGSIQYSSGGGIFQKQVFRKRFDILGGSAAGSVLGLADYETGGTKPLYNTVGEINNETHFVYQNRLENETKLFIIYAEDNMGNYVFRQVRFLGNKKPPKLTVYDITGENVTLPPNPKLPSLEDEDPPGTKKYYDNGIVTDAKRALYQTDLAVYQPTAYPTLKNYAFDGTNFKLNEDSEAQAYMTYPRNRLLKYWVRAERTNESGSAAGDLAIANIKMQDITYNTGSRETGHYDGTDRSLSYVEMLPEVTQRNFRFTATDSLGNEAVIQRTIAVTNTATLNNITTTTQSGTYGIGEKITLQANFSNLVRWTGTKPELNVRYKDTDGAVKIKQLPVDRPDAGVAALSLEFDFVVEENFGGILQTMYISNTNEFTPGDSPYNDRPLYLPTGAKLLDHTRSVSPMEEPAFIPEYSPGLKWYEVSSSLQGKKTINLDGTRPKIKTLSATGKTEYSTNLYYFKAGETIEFTLEADKDIFTGNTLPVLQFELGTNNWVSAAWQKSLNSTTMVFTATVTAGQNGTINNSTNFRIVDASTIVDRYGNALTGTATDNSTGNFAVPAATTTAIATINIDTTAPPAPPTTLTGAGEFTGDQGTGITDYNSNPVLTINTTSTPVGEANVPEKTEYSLDGGVTWVRFADTTANPPTTYTNWTSANGTNALNILNGQWTVQTRFTDRAGNIGAVTSKKIHVNAKFPDLKTIIAVQSAGTYGTNNTNNTLKFNLSFDAAVWTQNTANVTITLTNRSGSNVHKAGGTTEGTNPNTHPSFQRQLTATAVTPATAATTTISFEWTNIGSNTVNGNSGGIKEMLDGLYISAVDFTGLRDRFGNSGGTGTTSAVGGSITIPISGGYPNNVVTNLNGAAASLIKVDSLAPVVTAALPANASGRTGNLTTAPSSISGDNKTIVLTFDEPVQRGRGTITVRPHGNYAIPAVIGNDEMNSIYNNMTSTTDRNYLITGGTLASPTLSNYTGLSAGPYKKMTHGLKLGDGYTGSYSGTNAPRPTQTGSMIPDTTTKWVLDYQYQIHSTTQTQVTNIRNALTRMGYRRQDIAVTSTSNVRFSSDNKTVTIELSEPLLQGLQWGLFYPSGTFTDTAGNSAPAVGPDLSVKDGSGNYTNILANSTFWFWSNGVQTPVIRVDRKSYDARNTTPPTGTQVNPYAQTYAATGYNGSIESFDEVHYRIETETPGAKIFYGTKEGADNSGSATGAWTGTYWNGGSAANTGQWIENNLIYRNRPGGYTYTASDNGVSISHTINYYGFRSFNRDALESELDGTTSLANGGIPTLSKNPDINDEGSFDYDDPLKASKNYVAAEARVVHNGGSDYDSPTYTSGRGYEGVFRTVMALNQSSWTDGYNILLLGTNVKSGIPTIAGFPVRDGVANADTRYLKLFYKEGTGRYYWVSTEIVSSWYMQTRGRGSGQDNGSGSVTPNGGTGWGYGNQGDSNDWITAGYGDLSLGVNINAPGGY